MRRTVAFSTGNLSDLINRGRFGPCSDRSAQSLRGMHPPFHATVTGGAFGRGVGWT